jgi:hypothetical protein
MQSPPGPDPLRDETPFTTPLLSAGTDDQAADDSDIDPLVARTAKRIADVINDFKRELDHRDSAWGEATGTIELSLKNDDYELSIIQDPDGEEYPITVRATQKRGEDGANGDNTVAVPVTSVASKRTRRDSDADLEKDIVSRKKRRLQDDDSTSRKRARTDDEEEEDAMPLVSKEDLADLLSKLREDVQDDTSECVNHVQRLVRRFRQEWQERTRLEEERAASVAQRQEPSFRDSVGGNTTAFPLANVENDDQNISTNEVIRQEAKLLSSQIRWVEECRRVAASMHDKREENWRTSSAGFHDRNRQDRENFQNRMLHESALQAKVLNQILNEVKAIGLYTQSMKWETPDHLSTHPTYPPPMATPAFPTQAPPTAGRGRGKGNQR